MLSIKNLTKKFGPKVAVDRLSIEIKPGEIFALIGPNGSGKTTTIKIITGLLQPTDGSVTVADCDVTKQPIKAKAALGYIPDEPSIWSGMTGEEFLHFTGSLYGMPTSRRIERIRSLLDDFALKGLEKEYFENYSRGNKQKFTIIAALMHEPKLLLIDEPIVGLDPTSAEIAKKKFVEFSKKGGAVLLATHTLPVAEEIATRIGVLASGRLVATGSMSELRSRSKVSSGASLEQVYMAFTS
ncbi:MAG: hypothetical protein A3B30_01060 [Candidatus Komeilibacteria bacterium RIFCSPLOWO2_01_FULL_52_15]|uniref:ABC transporter domain-containing protein n=2 Tax=Candidatus Komeiliibacteriota TaxID=1817908 RepID=A0A1G2BT56_9BACT|nr:MAG: hypothetical protein A2677_00040 [Candidatus Komeilibacteria bacterium RIFCSPHIGHO2_01_FULL_52_14]OGY91540.1 MAG: hypothetical protein A3B30_01060 [Candidatus Komeilibacteria bacterium RIFCSPLOWO2_01_FULL_52_15]